MKTILENYAKLAEEENNQVVEGCTYQRVRIEMELPHGKPPLVDGPRPPTATPQEIRGSRYGDTHYNRSLPGETEH